MFRRAALVVVIGLLPVAAVMACSDPPAKPPPAATGTTAPPTIGSGGGEGGVTLDGSVEGGEAGVCNDLVLETLIVDKNAVPSEPPAATGGTIEDGTYVLTDYTLFVGAAGVAGPTGITARSTIRISGGTVDEVIELAGTGKTATTTRTSGNSAVTGSTFAQTQLCPALGGGKQRQFTSNPPLLILTDVTLKEAFTFTKR